MAELSLKLDYESIKELAEMFAGEVDQMIMRKIETVQNTAKTSDNALTRKEIQKKYHISEETLVMWHNLGFFQGVRVKRGWIYLESEIIDLLKRYNGKELDTEQNVRIVMALEMAQKKH